jgi:hypothetical protein
LAEASHSKYSLPFKGMGEGGLPQVVGGAGSYKRAGGGGKEEPSPK